MEADEPDFGVELPPPTARTFRYGGKIKPPIVSAAVATLILTNAATISVLEKGSLVERHYVCIDMADRTHVGCCRWAHNVLYKSLVDLVDELEEREANAQHFALRDGLTGLAARPLLEDRIVQALTRYRRANVQMAPLMLDLDRFKQVNDTFGHETGDLLVKEVGDRLRALLRETDTVGRVGGDEFAIVLSSPPDEETVRRLCTAIIDAIAVPFEIGDVVAEVGISIGVALLMQGTRDVPEPDGSCAAPTAPCTRQSVRGATASGSSDRGKMPRRRDRLNHASRRPPAENGCFPAPSGTRSQLTERSPSRRKSPEKVNIVKERTSHPRTS